MSVWRLILRGLRHDWRVNACIVLGLALAGAVVAGSLMVGDSMAGTLRRTAEARLGKVTHALVAPRPFTDSLADRLAVPGRVSALLLSTGSALHPGRARRACDLDVIGVDASFWQFFPPGNSVTPAEDGVLINEALAGELGIAVGDDLLLDLGRAARMSGNVPFASRRRRDAVRSWRVTVAGIVPDRAGGSFELAGETSAPRNVFADRARLAEVLQLAGRANVLLATLDGADATLPDSLRRAVRLADHGLLLRDVGAGGAWQLESSALLLTERQLDAARSAAEELAATASVLSVQLATRVKPVDGRANELAYAMVAAFSDPPGFATLRGAPPGNDAPGLWLNEWSAEDLQARVGEELDWTFLVPRDDGELEERTLRLPLRGIVRLADAAADRRIVPDLDGLTDATRIDQWQAPFPIDFDRITDRDEQYWEAHGPTSKAIVDLATMQRAWRATGAGRDARFATAVRFVSADLDPARLERAILEHLAPEDGGLAFAPVRERRLAAASGPTDFGPLFLGLSFFLIVAAVALAALLMDLLAEQRAAVTGMLLATGWTPRQVARWARRESSCLVVVGAVLGVALGVAYARILLVAMDRYWAGPWNRMGLDLTVTPTAVLSSLAVVVVVGLPCHWWFTRRVRRRPVLHLLARGPVNIAAAPPRSRRWHRAALAVAAWLVALALLLRAGSDSPDAALPLFLAGAATLGGAVAALWAVLARPARPAPRLSLTRLAIRNAGVRPAHGLLVFGTLASACFVLVAVAAHRRDPTRLDWREPASGAGGFYLRVTTSVPLRIDPSTPQGRARLGFDADDERHLAGTTIVALRAPGGDEVSCLNLARPIRPRLLGVPPALIDQDRFQVLTQPHTDHANPWHALLNATDSDGAIPVFGDAESVRWQLQLGLGSTLSFPGDDGREVRVRIVGLLRDSIFAGELLVAEERLPRPAAHDGGWSVLLVAPDPDRGDLVADLLRSRLDAFGVRVETTPDLLARFAGVKNTYLSIFQTLGGLGLLLGAVGLPVLMARGLFERRRELALLAALGFSRRRITRLLLLEHAGLLLGGVVCGSVAALLATAPSLRDAAADFNWPALAGSLGTAALVGVVVGRLVVHVGVRRVPVGALREE